ncbi:MAG TPA: FAD-dependent oxidoreductase [Opitutaceae bacterium]|nr:FAD-dependent oxidoreductase [Opitutaceae bacterium]
MDLVSGTPFWPARNGLIASYPALESSVECDVAVLGAGITGALVAWHLAEAGVHVVVLDKRDVATGSTCASTSLLQYEVDLPLRRLVKLVGEDHAVRAYRTCLAALGKIARLDRLVGGSHGFLRTESLQGASRDAHVPALRRELELRRLHGFDVEWWSRAQLARLSTLPFPAALIGRDAAQIDAHRFTHSLLRAATDRGARVYDRTLVARHTSNRHGVTLHTDHGRKIRARHLVVATGYEVVPYLADKLTELVVTFAMVTEPRAEFPGWPGARLIWETAQPYVYLRRTDDGRAIIGGYDEKTCDPRRRTDLLPRKTALLARRFRKLLPKAPCEIAYSWAGTFAETPDGLPYIGMHPGVPHTFFALGYGGNGITFSVIAAEIIRDLVCEGHSRDAELFRFDRVSAGSR